MHLPIKRLSDSGFSTVEILLSVSALAILASALIGGMVYSQTSALLASDRHAANLLADEGLEAVRNISDANFSNLVLGTYGLSQSGGTWGFSSSADVTGKFTRQIIIEEMLTSAGTVDPNFKKATSTISWSQDLGGTKQVSTSTQIANWKKSTTKQWAEAYLRSGTNIPTCSSGLKVDTVGSYAYAICPSAGTNFIVLNISNTSDISVASSLSLSGTPTNIDVLGNYAYISSRNDSQELQIVNISNSSAPVITGSYNAVGTEDALGVYAFGTTAYLTRVNAGTNPDYVEVNVNNPASPSLINSLNLNATAYEVLVLSGPSRYVATADDSGEVIEISNALLGGLQVEFSLNLTGTVDATTITGTENNELLVGQGSTFYTIAQPEGLFNFSVVGSLATDGTIQDIATNSSETLAFVGSSGTSDEFRILNITSKSSPSVLKQVDVPGSTAVYGVAWNSTLDKAVLVSDNPDKEAVLASPN